MTTSTIHEEEQPLLGVEALAVLGLAVDPTTGTLKPTRAYTARLSGVVAVTAP